MTCGTLDFTIKQGETFNPVISYSSPLFTIKPITGITQSGQAKITAVGHGIVNPTLVFVVGANGMTQINSKDIRRLDRAYTARLVDVDNVLIEVDSSEFTSYTSGGELLYHTPINLTGYTARMQIREFVDSTTTLASLTTENGGITLGGTTGSITVLITATATAAFSFTSAVYDLEVVSPAGVVIRVVEGVLILSPEVTRT